MTNLNSETKNIQNENSKDELIAIATQNVRDILEFSVRFDPKIHKALVVFDTQNELTNILTESYRRNLPSATFIDFDEMKSPEIIAEFAKLSPSDLVVLIQTGSFRLDEFRIRIHLFNQKLKVIEHLHLYRNPPQSWEIYVNSLSYNPDYYNKMGTFLQTKLANSQNLVFKYSPKTELITQRENETENETKTLENLETNPETFTQNNSQISQTQTETLSQNLDKIEKKQQEILPNSKTQNEENLTNSASNLVSKLTQNSTNNSTENLSKNTIQNLENSENSGILENLQITDKTDKLKIQQNTENKTQNKPENSKSEIEKMEIESLEKSKENEENGKKLFELSVCGELEMPKLNTGNYDGMLNIGGTFPIGEVFCESKMLENMNGQFWIWAFADSNFEIMTPPPFWVKVENGLVVSWAENAPSEFIEVIGKVKEIERPIIREIGFGLNSAISRTNLLGDITAFERIVGVHLSLGEKHSVYKKAGIITHKSRFHVDLFLLIDQVLINGEIIFENGKYVV